MTEEISIRASRARRGADITEELPETGTAFPVDDAGETAWHLGESPSESRPRETDTTRETESDFPAFPGLGGEEEEESGPGLDIQRFIRGVWKRRWLVVGVATAVTLLFGLLAFTLLKHKWEAIAVLMVRAHQDRFALGSSTPFKPQEYNLKTLLDTIKLPSSLDAVMEATGISVKRRTLAGAIDVAPGDDSNMFQVIVTWKDPQTAANIANRIAERLVERTRNMRRDDAEEVYDYYLAQLEETRANRRAISAEMKELQTDNKVASFDTEIDVLIEEISRLDAEHSTKVAEVGAMRSAQARLEDLIVQQPEKIIISTIQRNPLTQRLTDYQWQLQEGLSRYTPENPKIIKLQKRISILEQMIEESKDEGSPQHTYAPNNQLTDLKMRLQGLTDELKVREAQVVAIAESLEEMRARLANLSTGKKEYELIASRLDGATTLESNLIGRVDEARVIMLRNEAMFELVEPARPPVDPQSSGRKLLVAAGMVLGGGAGLFLALLLELLDPFARSRRDAMDLSGSELAWELQRVPDGRNDVLNPNAPMAPVALLFRRIGNEMEARLEDDDWRMLGIASVEPEAGRSLVATNLARTLALKEESVILVDTDLRPTTGRRPSDLLGLPADQPGIREALDEGAATTDLLSATDTRGLDMLGPGMPPAGLGAASTDSLLALGTGRMRALVADLERSGRRVLFDLPPLAAQETVVEAAAEIGNLLLVVRSGRTRRSELRQTAEMLQERGASLRGVLVTDVPVELLSSKPLFDRTPPKSGRQKRTQEPQEHLEPTLGTQL